MSLGTCFLWESIHASPFCLKMASSLMGDSRWLREVTTSGLLTAQKWVRMGEGELAARGVRVGWGGERHKAVAAEAAILGSRRPGGRLGDLHRGAAGEPRKQGRHTHSRRESSCRWSSQGPR